jgi:hypothetical protein
MLGDIHNDSIVTPRIRATPRERHAPLLIAVLVLDTFAVLLIDRKRYERVQPRFQVLSVLS